MSVTEWRVAVGADETSAVYERADGEVLFVCAHGAGGNMTDRGVLATAKVMLARGIDVVRFNFLYKEKKSGRPDPVPKLMETITAVVERARGGEAEAGDHRWALDGGARGVDARGLSERTHVVGIGTTSGARTPSCGVSMHA